MSSVRPRQDPVSCKLCRTRKLRCNRQQPCGNCQARGVECERYGQVQAQVDSVQITTDTQAAILDRLQRLEELFLRTNDSHHQTVVSIATPQSIPSVLHDRPSDIDITTQAESNELQEVGTREASVLAGLSHGVVFKACSIDHILDRGAIVENDDSLLGGARQILFPPEAEALHLFDIYFKYIADFHHFVHQPTVTEQLTSLYDCLKVDRSLNLSHAALVLSIFAASAAVQTVGRNSATFFPSSGNAKALAIEWSKSTFDVLDDSRRVNPGSVEDIQALANVTFLLFNFEGFSARCRVGFSMALAMARDLGLHRIDLTPCKIITTTSDNSDLENEVKRRIWWHLAASDWFIASSGGPTEGVYSVNPKHCMTKLPRHIDDDALDQPEINLPLSEPTSMSYFLQRVKLAEISREVIDAIPPGSINSRDVSFGDVLVLDAKFESFLNNLPVFFRVDTASRRVSTDIHQRLVCIAQQRYSIGFMAYTRRCKLHQQFAMRASQNSKYAYSREICLQSARQVIEIQRQLSQESDTGIIAMAGNAQHLFFTTIALVMDLCLNKDNPSSIKVTKEEVVEACRMLEESQYTSPLAHKYVQSLMDTLRKHKIRLNERPNNVTVENDRSIGSSLLLSEGLEEGQAAQLPTDFDDIWQSYIENASSFDVPEWDQLFSDLDSQWT